MVDKSNFEDIFDNEFNNEFLYNLAFYDDLTGFPNRKKLEYDMKKEIQENENVVKAVFLIDVDRFHAINEFHGRHVGDQLLIALTERIEDLYSRDSDVYYNGEDEIYVILNDLSYFKLRRMGEKIHCAIAEPFEIEGKRISITSSIGMSHYPLTSDDFEEVLLQAEVAMNKVKRFGKDGYGVFMLEDATKATRWLQIEMGLKDAIKNNELFLMFQPKVVLSTKEVYAAEALIRWEHPKLGVLYPNDFIPIAEEIGFIKEMGYWVVEEAVRHAKEWHNAGYYIKVAVNISNTQLRDNQLVYRILEILSKYQLDPSILIIEITESTISNFEHMNRFIKSLKKNNIQVSIDDFGTGYSSLEVLRNLDVNMIKIDRSFIQDVPENSKGSSLIKTIIQMGKNLEFDVLAEGIETDIQRDFLIENECEFGQGYYFSKPICANQIIDFVKLND